MLAVVYFALRNSAGLVALVVGLWIVSFALRDTIDLSVTASGVKILALDVLSSVMVVIGVGRASFHGVRGIGPGLAFILLLLLFIHVIRGIADVGVQAAVNDARGWFYFTAAMVYTATVPGGWGSHVWKVLGGAGVLLALIAVSYMLVDGFGSASEQFYRNGELVSVRPLHAAGGLLILQAAILAPALRWPSRKAAAWMMIGAGAVTLLLMHRTLWVAGLAVGIVGFLWWSVGRGRKAPSTVLAATGLLMLLLPLAVWGFARTDPLVESATEPTISESTIAWRTTRWQELISSKTSASQLAVGESAVRWNTGEGGRALIAQAHNGFVESYARFGLPGVLVYCWLGLLLWFQRARIATTTGVTTSAVGLLIITLFVFSLTYRLDAVQGLIVGILVSGLVATPARAAVAPRGPMPAPKYGLAGR